MSGDATLGGALDVDLLGGFMPAIGSVFQIVSAAGGVDGKFADGVAASLVGASWQLRYNANAVLLRVALAGDFNFNGRSTLRTTRCGGTRSGSRAAAWRPTATATVDRRDDYAIWKVALRRCN